MIKNCNIKGAYLIFFLIMFSGCASWKEQLITKGNHNELIQNAVTDFIHTSNLYKKDNVFEVKVDSINEELLGVRIGAEINPLLVSVDTNKVINESGLPTRYIEQEGKIFYWIDSNQELTKETIEVLLKYTEVDTAIANVYFPEFIIDDSKKATHYYFCKDNFKRYKKVTTSKGMGWYAPPKLSCTR